MTKQQHGHLGVQELAEHLGVSRQRVYALMKTYDDFPAPAAELRAGPVWHTVDVEGWQKTRTVRAGGRPRAKHTRRAPAGRAADRTPHIGERDTDGKT